MLSISPPLDPRQWRVNEVFTKAPVGFGGPAETALPVKSDKSQDAPTALKYWLTLRPVGGAMRVAFEFAALRQNSS